jgi:hypothetical protein
VCVCVCVCVCCVLCAVCCVLCVRSFIAHLFLTHTPLSPAFSRLREDIVDAITMLVIDRHEMDLAQLELERLRRLREVCAFPFSFPLSVRKCVPACLPIVALSCRSSPLLCWVCFRRFSCYAGSDKTENRRTAFAYGHITLNAPLPVRSAKLSNVERT